MIYVYFIGMGCQIGLHDDIELELNDEISNVHYAYDGLVLDEYKLWFVIYILFVLIGNFALRRGLMLVLIYESVLN